ncbi:hypothetical protein [Microcoleus sp. N9_A1]|uniref:hypothetical protein n=1 Tax=Microcoleus sp. N9_A1 TaxID=3055380 RepID=UPI002FD3A16A
MNESEVNLLDLVVQTLKRYEGRLQALEKAGEEATTAEKVEMLTTDLKMLKWFRLHADGEDKELADRS